MANVNANINVNIQTQQAAAQLRKLSADISRFNQQTFAANSAAAQQQRALNQALVDGVRTSGHFRTSIVPMTSAVENFSNSIEKGKLSLGQYTRYAASQLPGMRRVFTREFDMINRVAEMRVRKLNTQFVALGESANGMRTSLAMTPTALDQFAARSAIALQRQQIFNRLLRDGSTQLLNWGKNTQWAGRQLMVGFTIPLGLLGAQAAKVFRELEAEAINFKKVYGDMFTTDVEVEKNLAAVKELSVEMTKYGQTIQQTMQLANTAAQSGARGAELMAATTQATRLAVLGQMEQNQAIETTISLQTAFTLSNEQLAESINFLNSVENQTILSLQDVSEAIPRVASVIKGFGGNVQDLSVLLVAMKEGGVSAAEGANALKNSMARVIAPTKQALDVSSKYGISLREIVSRNEGKVVPLFQELAQALESIGGQERQQVLSAIFGKFQYARIGTLLSNIAREGSQAAKAIELTGMEARDLALTAEKELGAVEGAVSTKFTAALEKAKLALAPVGEEFLKALTPVLESVGKILDKFNELPGGIKTAIVAATGIIGGIAPIVLMVVGLVANGIANIAKFILFLRKQIATLRGNGEQFKMYTSAELEAAAAAASLEGKTSSLTKTMLLQRPAIETLITLYNRLATSARTAAAAMPTTMGGVGIPFVGPRGGGFRSVAPRLPVAYRNTGGEIFESASGKTMVPGSGNTDTVPAMLTPGEFVINKKATKENLPLIQAINSGDFSLNQSNSLAGAPAEGIQRANIGLLLQGLRRVSAGVRPMAASGKVFPKWFYDTSTGTNRARQKSALEDSYKLGVRIQKQDGTPYTLREIQSMSSLEIKEIWKGVQRGHMAPSVPMGSGKDYLPGIVGPMSAGGKGGNLSIIRGGNPKEIYDMFSALEAKGIHPMSIMFGAAKDLGYKVSPSTFTKAYDDLMTSLLHRKIKFGSEQSFEQWAYRILQRHLGKVQNDSGNFFERMKNVGTVRGIDPKRTKVDGKYVSGRGSLFAAMLPGFNSGGYVGSSSMYDPRYMRGFSGSQTVDRINNYRQYKNATKNVKSTTSFNNKNRKLIRIKPPQPKTFLDYAIPRQSSFVSVPVPMPHKEKVRLPLPKDLTGQFVRDVPGTSVGSRYQYASRSQTGIPFLDDINQKTGLKVYDLVPAPPSVLKDKYGRSISREEYNRRENFRNVLRFENNPKIRKQMRQSEMERRENYRKGAQYRFGEAAIKTTEPLYQGGKGVSSRLGQLRGRAELQRDRELGIKPIMMKMPDKRDPREKVKSFKVKPGETIRLPNGEMYTNNSRSTKYIANPYYKKEPGSRWVNPETMIPYDLGGQADVDLKTTFPKVRLPKATQDANIPELARLGVPWATNMSQQVHRSGPYAVPGFNKGGMIPGVQHLWVGGMVSQAQKFRNAFSKFTNKGEIYFRGGYSSKLPGVRGPNSPEAMDFVAYQKRKFWKDKKVGGVSLSQVKHRMQIANPEHHPIGEPNWLMFDTVGLGGNPWKIMNLSTRKGYESIAPQLLGISSREVIRRSGVLPQASSNLSIHSSKIVELLVKRGIIKDPGFKGNFNEITKKDARGMVLDIEKGLRQSELRWAVSPEEVKRSSNFVRDILRSTRPRAQQEPEQLSLFKAPTPIKSPNPVELIQKDFLKITSGSINRQSSKEIGNLGSRLLELQNRTGVTKESQELLLQIGRAFNRSKAMGLNKGGKVPGVQYLRVGGFLAAFPAYNRQSFSSNPERLVHAGLKDPKSWKTNQYNPKDAAGQGGYAGASLLQIDPYANIKSRFGIKRRSVFEFTPTGSFANLRMKMKDVSANTEGSYFINNYIESITRQSQKHKLNVRKILVDPNPDEDLLQWTTRIRNNFKKQFNKKHKIKRILMPGIGKRKSLDANAKGFSDSGYQGGFYDFSTRGVPHETAAYTVLRAPKNSVRLTPRLHKEMLAEEQQILAMSKLNSGGFVSQALKLNNGNIVPGLGNTDTVPAMLTPGEFVVNKQATQENLPLLHAINDGKTEFLSKGGRSGDSQSGRRASSPFKGGIKEEIRELRRSGQERLARRLEFEYARTRQAMAAAGMSGQIDRAHTAAVDKSARPPQGMSARAWALSKSGQSPWHGSKWTPQSALENNKISNAIASSPKTQAELIKRLDRHFADQIKLTNEKEKRESVRARKVEILEKRRAQMTSKLVNNLALNNQELKIQGKLLAQGPISGLSEKTRLQAVKLAEARAQIKGRDVSVARYGPQAGMSATQVAAREIRKNNPRLTAQQAMNLARLAERQNATRGVGTSPGKPLPAKSASASPSKEQKRQESKARRIEQRLAQQERQRLERQARLNEVQRRALEIKRATGVGSQEALNKARAEMGIKQRRQPGRFGQAMGRVNSGIGKAGMGLGMGVSMAAMMPMMGANEEGKWMGMNAQGAMMGMMGAGTLLSVLPMLGKAALPVAGVAAAAAAVGFALYKWRDSVDSAARETAEYGSNLGVAANAVSNMAAILGKQDLLKSREFQQLTVLPGDEEEFASYTQMLTQEGGQGQKFIKELQSATSQDRFAKLVDYLRSGIAAELLTVEEAKLFAKAVGAELSDVMLGIRAGAAIGRQKTGASALEEIAKEREQAALGEPAIAKTIGSVAKDSLDASEASMTVGAGTQIIKSYNEVIAKAQEEQRKGIISFSKMVDIVNNANQAISKWENNIKTAYSNVNDFGALLQGTNVALKLAGVTEDERKGLDEAYKELYQGAGSTVTAGPRQRFKTAEGELLPELGTEGAFQKVAELAAQKGFEKNIQGVRAYIGSEFFDREAFDDIAKYGKNLEKLMKTDMLKIVTRQAVTERGIDPLTAASMMNTIATDETALQAFIDGGQTVEAFMNALVAANAEVMFSSDKLQRSFLDLSQELDVSGQSEAFRAYLAAAETEPEREKRLREVESVGYGMDAAAAQNARSRYLSTRTTASQYYEPVTVDEIVGSTAYRNAISRTRTATRGPGETVQAPVQGPSSSVGPKPIIPVELPETEPEVEVEEFDDTVAQSIEEAIERAGEAGVAGEVVTFALNVATEDNRPPGEVIDEFTGKVEDLEGLDEEVRISLGIDLNNGQDVETFGGYAEEILRNWGMLSALNPNIDLSLVARAAMLDENGNVIEDPLAMAKNIIAINKAYTDLEKAKGKDKQKAQLKLVRAYQAETEYIDENGEKKEITPEGIVNDANKTLEGIGKSLDDLPAVKASQVIQLQTSLSDSLAQKRAEIYALMGEEREINMQPPPDRDYDRLSEIAKEIAAKEGEMASLTADAAANILTVGMGSNTGANTASGGGGGGGKDSFVKTFKKGLLEQIKLWADANATMKDLNSLKDSFVQQVLKGQGLFDQLIGLRGLSASQLEQLVAGGPKGLKEFIKKYTKDGKLTKEGQNILDVQTVAGSKQIRKETRIGNIAAKNQIAATGILRQRGVDQDVIENIAGDANKTGRVVELQDMIKRGIKGSREELDKFIKSQERQVNLAEKAADAMKDPIQGAIEAQQEYYDQQMANFDQQYANIEMVAHRDFKARTGMTVPAMELQISKNEDLIDGYREEISVIEDAIRAIETKTSTSSNYADWGLEQLEKEIKLNQENIRKLERTNELTQRRVDALRRQDEIRNRESEAIDKDLEEMSRVEEDIKETYDKRIEALDKVAEINDHIINQQKQQLNLSRAISEGDIYAATQAAQEMRASSAGFAVEQVRKGLQTGMENQIEGLRTSGGLTREQAEERIRQIEEQSYQTSLQIRALEDEIYDRQINEILPLKDKEYSMNLGLQSIQDAIAVKQLEIRDIERSKIEPIQNQNDLYREQIDDLLLNIATQQANVTNAAGETREEVEMLNGWIMAGLVQMEQSTRETNRAASAAHSLAQQWVQVGDAINAAKKALTEEYKRIDLKPLEPDYTEEQRKAEKAAAYDIYQSAIQQALGQIPSLDPGQFFGSSSTGSNTNKLQPTYGARMLTLPGKNQMLVGDAFDQGIVYLDKEGRLRWTNTKKLVKNFENENLSKYSVGGSVLGSGARDSINAMLTPGEFVVRKAMVDKYGKPFFEKINQGSFSMPRYSVPQSLTGSPVVSTSNMTSISAPVYNTYDMKFSINGTNQSSDEIANKVMFKMQQLQNQQIRGNRGY